MHIWTAVININNAFANVRAVTSGGGKWGFAQVTWHGAPHGIFSQLKKNWGGGGGGRGGRLVGAIHPGANPGRDGLG